MKYWSILFLLCIVGSQAFAQNRCSITVGSMDMAQSVPEKVSIGEEYVNDIQLKARGPVRDVQATVYLLEGTKYIKSAPPAELDGDKLIWKYRSMNAGEAQNIKVWLQATREGELTTCGTVTSVPVCCATTFAGKAELSIEKTGPAVAILGERVNYTITIKNTGSATAKDVKLLDRIPDGLVYSKNADDRKEIYHVLGDLPPGTVKTFTLGLYAVKRGRVCNYAEVSSANTETVNSEACTEIKELGATLALQCREISYIGKQSKNTITMKNTGDAPLTNVVVRANISDKLNVIKTSEEGQARGNTITWSFPQLAPGETKNIDIIVISKYKGQHCIEVSLENAQGVNKRESCCTIWEGFAAILIEMIDTEDPLIVGEETTYIIKITNQGTADDKNVKIHVEFPPEVSPLSASGATKGTLDGKRVDFEPYPVFRPKQVIEFRVRAKGVSVGDARIRVYLTSELLKTPVPEEESTHVY